MCDLMPASIHAILNDVETSLSLPALLIIVLCTIQFAVTHLCHIICTIKEILRKRAEKKRRHRKCAPPGASFMERLKGMFCHNGCPPSKCGKKPKKSCGPCADENKDSVEDDWDDDDEDDFIMDD